MDSLAWMIATCTWIIWVSIIAIAAMIWKENKPKKKGVKYYVNQMWQLYIWGKVRTLYNACVRIRRRDSWTRQ